MTEETDIEKMKKKNEPDKDIYAFVVGLIQSLINLVIFIIIGTFILYSCKVAQARLIPFNKDFSPYIHDKFPKIPNVIVDVNIVKTAEAIFSTKIQFPVKKNLDLYNNNSLLSFLTSLKESPKSNVYKLYFASIIENIISTDLSLLNSFYKIVNNLFTESLIIFVLPIIFSFVFFILSIINFILFIFYWFYDLYLLFSTKTSGEGQPSVWKDGNAGYIKYFLYLIIAFWVFIFTFFITGFIAPILAVYSFIVPLFMESEVIVPGGKPKPYNIKSLFVDVLKYKHSVIMYIISYLLISNTYSSYGNYAAVIAFVMCGIIYFFIPSVYKRYLPTSKDYATLGLTPPLQEGGEEEIPSDKEVPSSITPTPTSTPSPINSTNELSKFNILKNLSNLNPLKKIDNSNLSIPLENKVVDSSSVPIVNQVSNSAPKSPSQAIKSSILKNISKYNPFKSNKIVPDNSLPNTNINPIQK